MVWFVSLLGKAVVWLSRHLGGGHGSALPGLIVEKLYPKFLNKVLTGLPGGVVLVSGTNGKTTTTKIIVDLLRADGYQVFTNRSGSNYTRGVISAALPQMRRGKLPVDIAVLELDEAYATQFVDQVKPRYAVLLNVLRDQLDRFGEIDNTAKLLQYVARKTTGAVVTNEDDLRLRRLADDNKIKAKLAWFGYDGAAACLYRNDEELHCDKAATVHKKPSRQSVRIASLDGDKATYLIDGNTYTVRLRLFGAHNALNCAAALSVVRQIEDDEFNSAMAVEHLGAVAPAYGRGEVITVGDAAVQLILVKNPSGFQISLDSSANVSTMVAINDDYADGRDVSWLWDVSFGRLNHLADAVTVTGVRAADMTVRLMYDGVTQLNVEADLSTATRRWVHALGSATGQIFATYTAMLQIRDELEQMSSEVNNG